MIWQATIKWGPKNRPKGNCIYRHLLCVFVWERGKWGGFGYSQIRKRIRGIQKDYLKKQLILFSEIESMTVVVRVLCWFCGKDLGKKILIYSLVIDNCTTHFIVWWLYVLKEVAKKKSIQVLFYYFVFLLSYNSFGLVKI